MLNDSWKRTRPISICIVVAAPLTLKAFLIGHISALAQRANITLVADFAPEDDDFPWPANVSRIRLPIQRKIAPYSDGANLWSLYRLFRRHSFDIVQSVTPKAGLLAMAAACTARCPRRIHWFTGQIWATRRGWKREALKAFDKLIAVLATHILVDGNGQRELLIRERVVAAAKAATLGDGSISGVDVRKFHPDPAARRSIRAAHSIPDDACVLLFVGRLNVEKGLLELAEALSLAGRDRDNLWLMAVGPAETEIWPEMRRRAGERLSAKMIAVGFSATPQRYMAAADVFCLPSHREGFGTSVIEAAACGLPAVVSDIYGLQDAVIDQGTGLRHRVGSGAALAQCIGELADNPGLRRNLGEAARQRATTLFPAERLTGELLNYYAKLL